MAFHSKVFLLLFFAATLVSSHTIRSLVDECKKTVAISDELEKSFLELQFPPEEEASRCLMHCIGETLQLFDGETGAVRLDNIKTLLGHGSESSQEEFSEEHIKCLEEVSDDKEDSCSMAFQVYQCFEKEFLELMKKDLDESK
ncbi:general odorant-binding protein 99a-like [Sabethes cyaneus]|uniref:general odorant-binding protein 99a-like n=1 Tax=Sabethes cyaneus TaxID=53552 RepID=UPI00237E18A7|nr:general odorant-binding protein 99a-like [Sabethes cyaneus]